MDKSIMIEKLLQKYGAHGVTVEEITYMVEAGFDYGLDSGCILQNVEEQINEEHKGE